MVTNTRDEQLITETSLQEYFQTSLSDALENQNVEAGADTIHYVVSLLTSFSRAEKLFDRTPDGMMIRPLALVYAEAVEGKTVDERNRALRRLGDVALFISGIFSQSLNRCVVDVDYYVSMGGSAYSYLSDAMRATNRGRAMSGIYDELASKFVAFVDVLGEVSEGANCSNDIDLLRQYEIWLRTGSTRAADRLRAAGIHPSANASSRLRH
jgi:hypothetical protein